MNKVKEYRTKYGFTQQDIADKLKISRQSYSAKEAGQIEFRESEMFDLQKIYNVSLEVLFKKEKRD